MKINKETILAISLLILLIAVSFLKDELTPDYRNTPDAGFLNPQNLKGSRLSTVSTHSLFWIKSILYSITFIIIPTYIIRFALKNPLLARFTLLLHILLVVALYAAVFLNIKAVDVIFVSKVNRYLHSPIITLFLWAAFTITTRETTNE